MADAKLTALTAASALAAADLFYVSQSAASRKATGTQLLALVGTAYVPLAGGTMTGALTIASGTLTASAPALSITQTWNNAGVAFTGLLIDITNTSSSSSSRTFQVQVGGSQVFGVRTDGYAFASAGLLVGSGGTNGAWDAPGPRVKSTGYFSWAQSTNATDTADLLLYRDAAATLAQRNGTTQQIFRLYNTYTDASNYERLTLTGVAGTSVNITAETLGTGGDNLDIVLTPAGTGTIKIPSGTFDKPGLTFSAYPTSGIWLNSSGAAIALTTLGASALFTATSYTSFPAVGVVGWSSAGVAGQNANDAGLARDSAGVVEVNNGTRGTWRDLKLRNLLNTEYHQMTEMTAPSAPAANSVRIYAEDNGSGKTRLMALFATGVAQQLAIEP